MANIYNFQLLADGAIDGGAEAAAENSPAKNTGAVQNPDSADNDGFDAGSQTSANESGGKDPAARAREFEKLIKGDYKELFDSKVQTIIDRRFKSHKAVLEEAEKSKPIIDMLMQRYGTSDTETLKAALEGDTDYWETAADKEGLEVEQYKELMRLRAENQRFHKEHEMTEQQRYIQAQIENWQRQGEELKAIYPEFDLKSELSGNPEFQKLLKAGISMQQAYELIHSEEIRAAIKEQTEKAVMEHIRANGSRPVENGIKNSNSFVLGKNVADLTKEEREAIKRRVQQGEKIIL